MQFGLPSTEIVIAILCSLAAPVSLFASQWLISNVSSRFFFSAAVTLGCYVTALVFAGSYSLSPRQIVAGFAFIVAVLIFELGFWGVLTRGYTVAILLALQQTGDNAPIEQVQSHYAGGRGLGWFMEKRLKGLRAAGVTKENDERIYVTPFGVLVLLVYRSFMTCFRLSQFG